MFRITERHDDSRVVLKLEGRLSAGAVPALDACWHDASDRASDSSMWVDLSDVCVVDAAGEEQLARMHRAGVRFLTRGLMCDLVREIAEAR